jgi:HEPN domain-containing protein
MNERIFELAKQADLIQWDTLPSGARTPDHESVVKARKFAELIVAECLMKAIGAKIRGESIDTLIQNIKEDFGVDYNPVEE